MITKDTLKEIVDLVETVPEKFKEKCFELLLTNILEKTKPVMVKVEKVETEKEGEGKKDNSLFKLPVPVKAFLAQYQLNEDAIEKLFVIEGDDIHPIYKLKSTSSAASQIELSLLLSLKNALKDGRFGFSIEDLRKLSQDEKCYDKKNFAGNLSRKAKFYKNIDADIALLTSEGKEELADIIEKHING